MLQTVERNGASLVALVDRAAKQLAAASSAAEILDARDMADMAYAAAKKAARLAKAKGAHDELIAKAHRAQADALEIEALAKLRLADEYDAAQERDEIGKRGGARNFKLSEDKFENSKPGPADIGLTHQQIHEARQIRDAEKASPGIVRETLNEKLDAGEEPTKAALREAVIEAARQGIRGDSRQGRRNPHYVPPSEADKAWTHVYGTCSAFAEWATKENLALMRKGLAARTDDQSSNIRAVKSAAKVLAKIVESLNAH